MSKDLAKYDSNRLLVITDEDNEQYMSTADISAIFIHEGTSIEVSHRVQIDRLLVIVKGYVLTRPKILKKGYLKIQVKTGSDLPDLDCTWEYVITNRVLEVYEIVAANG
jgi:hypothetical protein